MTEHLASAPEATAPVTPPTLEGLRREGAQAMDPVRFRYLDALAQRAEAAPEAVRQALAPRLATALAEYATRWQAAQVVAQEAAREQAARLIADSPKNLSLARELRAYVAAGDWRGVQQLGALIHQPPPASVLTPLTRHVAKVDAQAREAAGVVTTAANSAPVDLRSVRRFHEMWSKIAAEVQVEKALHRAPEKAGPLNSHMLVLRSLAMMRELSPDYLRRFLSYADDLLWVDQAGQPQKAAEVKPAAKRARAKK